MAIRIIISDLTLTGHPETVRTAILAAYSGLTQAEIEIRAESFATSCTYAQSIGAVAVVRSTGGLWAFVSAAQTVHPNIQCFVPMGANSSVEITVPNYIPVIVTCGAGDTDNDTAYGNALEFWDDDNDQNPGVDASSFSNGIICGKILKIKDTLACSWWEARYRARQSMGATWDKFNGYGKIDVDAAIAFAGEIITDPYHQAFVFTATFTESGEAIAGTVDFTEPEPEPELIEVVANRNFVSRLLPPRARNFTPHRGRPARL